MLKHIGQTLLAAVERIGADPNDDDDLRLRKRILMAISSLIAVAAVIWGVIYLSFSEPLAASIPLAYAIMSAASIVVFGLTRRYKFFRFSQLVLILLLPFLLMVVLGGFINSSAVILWSLLAPFGALLISGRRRAVIWFAAYCMLVVLSRFLEPLVRTNNNLTASTVIIFFVLNIVGVSLVAFILMHYFVGQKNQALHLLGIAQEKSERLLLNVLPREIAAILKEDSRAIADYYDSISVLFADVVGFTPLSERLSPRESVAMLNEIFSRFDSIVERYGLEKIRTVGDGYMVASGVPTSREDHARVLGMVALEMVAYMGDRNEKGEAPLQIRVGINSGPAVAGIIGTTKFHYDVWGDAVNTAARMESHGRPGKIQIGPATYELIKDEFICTPRGSIDVKGKGKIETWFLEGVRA